jgi:hypothetical protein
MGTTDNTAGVPNISTHTDCGKNEFGLFIKPEIINCKPYKLLFANEF